MIYLYAVKNRHDQETAFILVPPGTCVMPYSRGSKMAGFIKSFALFADIASTCWKCHFLTCEMKSSYPFLISSSLVSSCFSGRVGAHLIARPPGVNDAPPVPSAPWRGWQWKRWRMKRTRPPWFPWRSMQWCTLSSMRYGACVETNRC